MSKLKHLAKEQQQLMPLFNGAFIENKPIPFPDFRGSFAYSNLFYWAHLQAKETSEFPLHPHEGFEIVTFIFKGSVEHFDTVTKVWTPLSAGAVQVIKSGSGVKHSERITKGTRLFQIWFDPDFSKSLLEDARYKDYQDTVFKSENLNGVETLNYVGNEAPIDFQTPGIEIKKFSFTAGEHKLELEENSTYSFYLLEGELNINKEDLVKDGFIVFNELKDISITTKDNAELFMIKSPSKIEYKRF